jgi:hypothetical protein
MQGGGFSDSVGPRSFAPHTGDLGIWLRSILIDGVWDCYHLSKSGRITCYRETAFLFHPDDLEELEL